MIRGNRIRLIRSSALPVLFAFALPAGAAQCLENRDFYQSLPTSIGREESTAKFPFALNCDTVFVRKGVTTVVHPNTLLFFSKPSLNSVIKVEGTLVVKGTKNAYAYLSGSLDSVRTGFEPGERAWGGIEVAEGGKLVLEFTGIMRAPTPITTFSNKVKLTNCFFKGSSGMILPDGNLLPMEANWHTINSLDLEKEKGVEDRSMPAALAAKPTDTITQKEKSALLSGKKAPFWTAKRALGTAAAVTAVGVGAVLYALPTDDGKPPNKPPAGDPEPKDTMDPLPLVPE